MLSNLWEVQTIIFAGLTSFVVLIALSVLLITSRRVRLLRDEVQSMRREMKLVDDALQTVTASLEHTSDREHHHS